MKNGKGEGDRVRMRHRRARFGESAGWTERHTTRKEGQKHGDANILTEAERITEADRQINTAFFIKPEHP